MTSAVAVVAATRTATRTRNGSSRMALIDVARGVAACAVAGGGDLGGRGGTSSVTPPAATSIAAARAISPRTGSHGRVAAATDAPTTLPTTPAEAMGPIRRRLCPTVRAVPIRTQN